MSSLKSHSCSPVGACLGLAALALLAPRLPAQQIAYEVAFPNAVHHEVQVTLTLTQLRPGPVELRMSRSSPGRYALHEFAKNVYAVRAEDGHGRAVALTRPNPYQWNGRTRDGTLRVRYTLFGDRTDGTYLGVDRSHAHINMPATFMWARGLDARPIRVTFHIPDGSGWKIATQLFPTKDPETFTAPGLQYFMDSPTELSDWALRSWTVTVGGRIIPYRMAVHYLGSDSALDSFAAMAEKVVRQEIAVYGETPRYDVGGYTFICDYVPWASGDGMEHRNSTFISSSAPLDRFGNRLIGTVSHEFFHSWNVERIRPRDLEPFDFERANMSGELWFAEGFTSYYGPLFIHRAGLVPLEQYAHDLGRPVNFVINSPARAFFSPVEMSMQAPFVDAATSIDPTNRGNTFISYYTWGSVVGLGLDLTLRERFHKPLDDFMRLMWRKYGKTEIPYTLDDLQRTLAQFTGDRAFAADFFRRYIRGREVPDFATLLAPAGLVLRPARPTAAFLGFVNLQYGDSGATIQRPTPIGSPLYQAGLDREDLIRTLDGRPLLSDSVWQAVKAAHAPGDTIAVEYDSRGERKTARVALVADPELEIVTFEEAGRPVTDAIRRFREAWLGPRSLP